MNVFGIISFIGTTIGALSAIDVLVDRKTNWEKISSFLLFASIGFVQLEWTIWFFDLDNQFPFIQITNLPFNLLIGPLLYIYLKTIHEQNWVLNKKYLIPFIPAIVIFIVLLPYYWLDFDTKLIIKFALDKNTMDHPYVWIIKFTRLLIFLQTNYFLIYFFIKTRSVFTLKSFSRQIITFHLLNVSLLTFSILLLGLFSEIFYSISTYLNTFRMISVMVAILQLYLHLIIRRYPNSAMKVKEEIKKIKYENSNLNKIDIEQLKNEFYHLFEVEKIFLNNSIKLDDIANKLNLGYHTISQFLNEVIGLSFYDFLNKYRIEEAEKILISEPTRTVLSIGLEVGFNSQSTFYSAFSKKWKMSPNDFRNKNNHSSRSK